jgi:hypothetical protein
MVKVSSDNFAINWSLVSKSMIAYLSRDKEKYSLSNGVNSTTPELIEKLDRFNKQSTRLRVSQFWHKHDG